MPQKLPMCHSFVSPQEHTGPYLDQSQTVGLGSACCAWLPVLCRQSGSQLIELWSCCLHPVHLRPTFTMLEQVLMSNPMKLKKKNQGDQRNSPTSPPCSEKCVNRCWDLYGCLLHHDWGVNWGLNDSYLPLISWIPSFPPAGKSAVRHNFVFCRKPCTLLQVEMDCVWSHFLDFLSTKVALHVCLQP